MHALLILVLSIQANAFPRRSPLLADGSCSPAVVKDFAGMKLVSDRYQQVVGSQKAQIAAGGSESVRITNIAFAKVVEAFRSMYGDFVCHARVQGADLTLDPRPYYEMMEGTADLRQDDRPVKVTVCAPDLQKDYLSLRADSSGPTDEMFKASDDLGTKHEATVLMLTNARKLAALNEAFRSKHPKAFRCGIPRPDGRNVLADSSDVERDLKRGYEMIRKLEQM